MNTRSFNSIFIRSFSPGDTIGSNKKSPIIYHYTSSESFLSIIKNKSIRFSDIRYMNDKSETTFFVKRLIEFIDERKKDYPLFCEAINILLEKNDYQMIKENQLETIIYSDFPGLKMEKQRTFIFCASNDADSLNMWNYYVSNGNYKGYNIGFSVENFLRTFDTDNPKIIDSFMVFYGNVIYDIKKQNEEISHFADTIEKFLSENRNTQNLHKAAISIMNYIVTRGPFFKNNSFKSENEYRILISIADKRIPRKENDSQKYFGVNNRKIQENFYSKNGLIVPFLQVSIPENAISRVTISPMTEFEIAKSSIKELLEIKEFKNETIGGEVPVYKSKIPVRF